MLITIFGNGMLGSCLHDLPYSIQYITRKDFDVTTKDWSQFQNIQGKVVINCIGLIPQKSQDIRLHFLINTIFPHALSSYCQQKKIHFIHISTDCVFDGKRGCYCEDCYPTPDTLYGISKLLGEPFYGTILRLSVIGYERHRKNLLEWALQQRVIYGYTNHYWNGITTLTFRNIIHCILKHNLFWNGAIHIHSPNYITKYQLCVLLAYFYQTHTIVLPHEHEIYTNRILSSLFKFFHIPPIEKQLHDLSQIKRTIRNIPT